MSTLIATTIQGQGDAGANIKVGNTSTYVSDNGAVTQNTVQGLIKVWMTLGVDAVQDDSFNCSSVDDDGTGDYGIHFTNDFNLSLIHI